MSSEDNFFERVKSYGIKKLIKIGLPTLVGLTALCQSFYIVSPDSNGVVRRLGAYTRTAGPGLHLKVPLFVEDVDKVPVQKVQKEEFGFRTKKAGIESEFISSNTPGISEELKDKFEKEYRTLTGDLNMANIEWIVQYQVKDAQAYLFNLREPRETIRDCSSAVMKQIIGDGSVDEAIAIGRLENQVKAKEELQKLLDNYDTGIHIVTVQLQTGNPPKRVQPSFNEVSRAMQEKERLINDARRAYNEVVPRAAGEAEATIAQAKGYAIERVNKAEGDVNKFLRVYEEFSKAPEITQLRLYLESMEKILPQLGSKRIIEQRGAEGGLLLNLSVDGAKK